MMKKILIYTVNFIAAITLLSCEIDNYDEPNALLEGQLVYQEDPVSVRSNSAELELWQDGYALNEFIPVFIAQDGSYSVSLFDGEYKLVRKNGNPWLPQLNDTIVIQVNGNTQFDVPVTPYFNVKNESFEIAGNTINASFQVSNVVESSDLQAVSIILGESILVDQNINEYSQQIDLDQINLDDPSDISIEIPENMRDLEYLFIRIGVRSSSSNELIYTQVQRLNI